MLHIRGLSLPGQLTGMGVLELHRRTLGAAIAAEDYETAVPLLKTANENALTIARAQCLAGDSDAGVKTAENYLRSQKQRAQPLAAYVEVLWVAGKKKEAARSFDELRKISGSIQFGSPVFDRNWELVGLHHYWLATDDDEHAFRNQGRRIERVIEGIEAAGAS